MTSHGNTDQTPPTSLCTAYDKAHATMKAATCSIHELVDSMPITDALHSHHMPAGSLLREAQGQTDLVSAHNAADRLCAYLATKGRFVTESERDDAVGAACLALVQ